MCIRDRFRERAAAAGRDPDAIPITVFALGTLSLPRLTTYAGLGVSRIVLPPPTMEPHGADDTLRHLDRLGEVLDALG